MLFCVPVSRSRVCSLIRQGAFCSEGLTEFLGQESHKEIMSGGAKITQWEHTIAGPVPIYFSLGIKEKQKLGVVASNPRTLGG